MCQSSAGCDGHCIKPMSGFPISQSKRKYEPLENLSTLFEGWKIGLKESSEFGIGKWTEALSKADFSDFATFSFVRQHLKFIEQTLFADVLIVFSFLFERKRRLLSAPSSETHHLLYQAGMWYFSTEECTCFAVRTQQRCLKTSLMMAKDQRWEVIAGGSLGVISVMHCCVEMCRSPARILE